MKRIFIDASKCDGCKNCSIACMQAHRDDVDQNGEHKWSDLYDLDLTDIKNESRNHIVKDKDGNYKPIFCRHCDEPECVMACMSGALQKNPETGHVEYDESRCASCFMCIMSCPYGVLKPDTAEHRVLIKCDFCGERDDGPRCVAACPKKAIYVEEV